MSAYAEAMKQIVQTLHPLLKEAGFRKRRSAFNRETEPGLVQVFDFQMGPYEPGPRHEFPPIKVNLYGKFTINLGVFLSEVHERLRGEAAPSFIPEYECELRKRLPELLPERELPVTDKGVGWWSLDEPPLKTSHEIRRLTLEYALPYLDTVKTRDGVIALWQREGDQAGLPPRAPLSIAAIQFHRGQARDAERLIRDYVAAGFKNPGHREFVEKIANSMGIAIS